MASIALRSAASGLSALNTRLDVIANNLANANTAGFKASRANFQDLFYIERRLPGVENANGDQSPTGLSVGLGVEVSGTQLNFEQGSPIQTGRELDLYIAGRGFFQVDIEDDQGNGIGYSRAGNFAINAEGDLVLATDSGRRLEPNINIPQDARNITISADGIIGGNVAGNAEFVEFGQLQLADFINPAGLRQIGENLYVESGASGQPLPAQPGTEGLGTIVQGTLEASNVDPTRELIELIRTQRSFELNSQVIRAADEALQQIGQLRR
ncbi:MAG: flagellar basal-body rod protein FlgG [Planctomycetota bacterium]